jgi:hypothetical protein
VQRRSDLVSLSLAALAALVPAAVVCSCSSSDPASTQDAGMQQRLDGALSDRARLDGTVRLDASCLVTVESPEILPSPHIGNETPAQYNSNPPSSGPHFAVWAAFKEYDKPVDRRYLVHSMEHGAVVIFYKCDDAGACPQIAAARAAAAAVPDDPACSGQGARVRVIIVPDPLLDVPLAVAAWGWVYKAQCVDRPTLEQFVREHYAQGPEDLCAAGQTEF